VAVTFRRHKSVTIFARLAALFRCSCMVQSSVCSRRQKPKKNTSQVRCNTTARWKTSQITAAARAAIDGVCGRVMLGARYDAGGGPLVSGSLCLKADRLCHSIRSFSVAVLRRLEAGCSLGSTSYRQPALLARHSHSEWFFTHVGVIQGRQRSRRLESPRWRDAQRPTKVGSSAAAATRFSQSCALGYCCLVALSGTSYSGIPAMPARKRGLGAQRGKAGGIPPAD